MRRGACRRREVEDGTWSEEHRAHRVRVTHTQLAVLVRRAIAEDDAPLFGRLAAPASIRHGINGLHTRGAALPEFHSCLALGMALLEVDTLALFAAVTGCARPTCRRAAATAVAEGPTRVDNVRRAAR